MKYCIKIFTVILVTIISSCSTAHLKVPYMVDAETIPADMLSQIQTTSDPVIGSNDLLNIEVTGSDMVAVSLFIKGKYITSEGSISQNTNNNISQGNYDKSTQYYLVDKDGFIDFPIVGKLHVGGKNKAQISEVIQTAI